VGQRRLLLLLLLLSIWWHIHFHQVLLHALKMQQHTQRHPPHLAQPPKQLKHALAMLLLWLFLLLLLLHPFCCM
jgi:hypothetical protein